VDVEHDLLLLVDVDLLLLVDVDLLLLVDVDLLLLVDVESAGDDAVDPASQRLSLSD
jgi:hypothetical protein